MLIPWLAGWLVEQLGAAAALYLPIAEFPAVFAIQFLVLKTVGRGSRKT